MQVKFNQVTETKFQTLNKLFSDSGFELFMAGGAVRDILQAKEPQDFDFTTNATPDQMMNMKNTDWNVIPTGFDHGTVTFMGNSDSFEVTTMRKDVETDGRHAKVEFTNSLRDDSMRRDFTMNAMFLDVNGNLFDFFKGQEDIKNNVVRFVGDAETRIKEDALRIMRFFRFVTKTNAKFVAEDFKAIVNNVELLKHISVERIWSEIQKTVFASPHNVSKFFELAFMSGAMTTLQIPGTMHFDSLNRVTSDIKGTQVFPTFVIGALANHPAIANDFADRFKVSSQERKEMVWFATQVDAFETWEDFGFDSAKIMLNSGVPRDWIKSFASFHNNGFLEEAIDDMVKTDFPVRGQDIVDAGVEPGPMIGFNMQELRILWQDSNFTMTKEELLKHIFFVITDDLKEFE